MFQNYNHTTVLQKETVQAILPATEQLLQRQGQSETFSVVDCTLGGGGHCETLIKMYSETPYLTKKKLCLFGVDRDDLALKVAGDRLGKLEKPHAGLDVQLVKTNFGDVGRYFKNNRSDVTLNALYADFGVSSPQLDHAERGFSFMRSGPLDMRMDQTQGYTARELLETAEERELMKIFFDYGEEPRSKKLASQIVKDRTAGQLPTANTLEFADYVRKHLGYAHSKVHPATRVFQALRIAVNDELGSIERLLASVPFLMSDFARVGFISFHSLEDRIVKKVFRFWESETKDELTGAFPVNPKGDEKYSWGREEPRGGIEPSEEECRANPRARSARLRVFQFTESNKRRGPLHENSKT